MKLMTAYCTSTLGLVVLVNFLTFACAKYLELKQRVRIEKKVESLAYFKKDELNFDSPGSVLIRGYSNVNPLRDSYRERVYI
jgi:hypothetical protein